jgi:WD40 repeat protein
VALPKPPQFEDALGKLSKAIHTDWEWVKYHTRLQVDALRWESNQRNPGYLVRGAALEESEQQLLQASGKDPQPTGLQAEYITTSRKEETLRQHEKLRLEQKARQRQWLVIWTVGIGLVVAMVLGVVAWGQRNQYLGETHVRATAQVDAENAKATAQANADEAERQAALAISSGLAAQMRNYLDTQYDLSLLRAAEALNVADTYAARDSLLTVLQRQPRLSAFLRTAEVYTDLAFSPDGNTLAGAYCSEQDSNSHCIAYEVQIWDIPTRQPAGAPISGVQGPLHYMADGKSLIVRHEDGQFALLDVQTRQVTNLPFANSGYAPHLALSPDGTLLAAAGCHLMSLTSGLCSGAYLLVWNFADGKLLYETDAANAYYADSLAFSPDGKMLVFSGCDEIQTDKYNSRNCVKGNLSAWDVRSGKVSTHMIDENTTVLTIAFSPDGSELAAGNNKGTLIFYETASWQEANRRLESDNNVEGLIYLPDGASLVSSSFAKPILVWDLETARRTKVLSISIGRKAMLMNPQGSLLAESGCYQYNNNGFVCLQGVVLLWDISAEPPLGHTFTEVNRKWRNSEFLSLDGKRLALAECVKLEKFNELNDKCVAGEITVVNTLTGALIGKPLTGLPSEIFTAAFSPDGSQLISVSCSQRENLNCRQSRIDWWEISTGQARHAPFIYDNWILNILLGPDEKTLYFAGQDNTIERLDLETGLPAGKPLEGFGLNEMAFSPDGKIMATSGCVNWFQTCFESEIKFWDTKTWQILGEPIKLVFDKTDVSTFGVSALEFRPEGDLIAIATKSGIRFWDLNQQQFQEMVIPVYNIYSMAFNRAGDILAVYSSSSNGVDSLVLWDLAKAQPIGSTYPVTDSSQFVFSLDDTQLKANSGIAWDVDPLSWQRRACQVANRNFTTAEWKIYMEDRPYQKTCPDLP